MEVKLRRKTCSVKKRIYKDILAEAEDIKVFMIAKENGENITRC